MLRVKIFVKILCVVLFAGIAGCTIFQEIAGNGPSSFRSPKKVENKITNPLRTDSRLSVLWIGHSTCLIQIDDKFILTDPVLTQTIGILSKRFVDPPYSVPPTNSCLPAGPSYPEVTRAICRVPSTSFSQAP